MKITRPVLFSFLGLFLISDRFLKTLAQFFSSPKELDIIPRILTFGYYPNPRLFFALDLPLFLVLGANLAALILLFIFFAETKIKHGRPFYFILAGGMSNFYDRLHFGSVIDFANLGNVSTFNFADIMIIIGLVFVLFDTRGIRAKNTN